VTTTLHRGEVKLVRWPAESARRDRYRALGVLRLLVVEGGVPAPVSADVREDWVRAPVSDDDLKARVASLRAKAEAHRLPHVDPNGVLRYAGRSITVSRTETDLLECLVRQFGVLVTREMLRECLPDRPGGASRNALDLHIMRVRRRIRPLGLVIRTVWGRGYLLEAADQPATPEHERPERPREPAPAMRAADFRADGKFRTHEVRDGRVGDQRTSASGTSGSGARRSDCRRS
jgi:DNA-binding winged helix-turn-helix (wHTH) protein